MVDKEPDTVGEAPPSSFRDEIFQWPIAKLNNEDVWNKIFENWLTNPTDKLNLLLASPQLFGPFLGDQKCSILFGEVAHILHMNNYLNLSNAEFLEYRCLSKSCKAALDHSLQMNNPCFLNLDGIDHDMRNPKHACWPHFNTSLNYYATIDSYAALIKDGTFAAGKSSPLVTGSIKFQECTYDDDQLLSFRSDFKLILSTFGLQIYHFQFNLWSFKLWSQCNRFSQVPTKYELLCEFLQMMPNLRNLKLEDYGDNRNETELDYECGMSGFNLPDLNHLEVLHIKNVTAWAVDTILRKYGAKLRKLSVNIYSWLMDELWYNGLVSPASHLTELSLPPINSEIDIGNFLRENINCACSLKSISILIEWIGGSGQKFGHLSTALLQIFENSERLDTLNIWVQSENYSEIEEFSTFFSVDDRLELSSVRRLWVFAVEVPFSSIDFILGLQESLEELVLNLDKCLTTTDGSTVELIQFVGYWHRMQESNVWTMMPKLQKITIRCTKNENQSKFPMECYEYNRKSVAVTFV